MKRWYGFIVVLCSLTFFATSAESAVIGGPFSDVSPIHIVHWTDHSEWRLKHWNDDHDGDKSWDHELRHLSQRTRTSSVSWTLAFHTSSYHPSRKDGDDPCPPDVGKAPIPSAALLFGSGLAFAIGLGRRKTGRKET
ncbi:MAG TPA: hypothetical protein VKA19_00685 [Alphaproteobacteria bacterium]|nr:hypothetical protein [Alphaproteobacteria bacterium]